MPPSEICAQSELFLLYARFPAGSLDAAMRVLVITLGATALQKFDEASGTMQLRLSPHDLLAQAAVEGCDTELLEMPLRR